MLHLEEHEPKQPCDSTLVKERRTFAAKVQQHGGGKDTKLLFLYF